MKKELNTNEFIQIILSICDNVEKEKDYLSELDRAAGWGSRCYYEYWLECCERKNNNP